LRDSFPLKKGKGFLITNLINVRYLTGFKGTYGFILVTNTRQFFVTDFRYQEEIERDLAIEDNQGRTKPLHGVEWDIFIQKGTSITSIRHLVKKLGIRSLAFESSISYDFFRGLSRCMASLVPTGNRVEHLREAKDREEVALIREAVQRAEGAFLDIKPFLKQGKRESDITRMLEERLKKRGCNHIPFDIIVASGVNSALPHAKTTEKKFSPGDFIVIDWGGEAGGYFSDMTRTVLLQGGDLSMKKEIYHTVLKANRAAVSVVRPGIEGKAIDRAARDSIKRAGYGKFFGHGTGHGVGLEVHELPRISRTGNGTVRENMVFTVEPGIYIKGLGGVRIEDMVLVRAHGHELLTALPRNLEILPH
jgi:Xaa-Pro aminopeptidase